MQELLRKRKDREERDAGRQRSKSSNYINSGDGDSDGESHIYQASSSFNHKRRPVSQGMYPSVPDDPEELNWKRSINSIRTIDETLAPIHKSVNANRK
jgi:hypothetical protein